MKDRRTIDKRLDGICGIGQEKEYCRILTCNEEKALVCHIRNENRCAQPIGRKGVTQIVINTLLVRKHTRYASHRRIGCPLSTHAFNCLDKQKLSKSFWNLLLLNHPDIRMKRPGNVSINRALNCTREMAEKHLDNLAAELISIPDKRCRSNCPQMLEWQSGLVKGIQP